MFQKSEYYGIYPKQHRNNNCAYNCGHQKPQRIFISYNGKHQCGYVECSKKDNANQSGDLFYFFHIGLFQLLSEHQDTDAELILLWLIYSALSRKYDIIYAENSRKQHQAVPGIFRGEDKLKNLSLVPESDPAGRRKDGGPSA